MTTVVMESLGRFIPARVVTNEDLVGMMHLEGVSPEEIREKTGIEERRFVTDETLPDMAVSSVAEAVKGFDGEIDELHYVANTPPPGLARPERIFAFSDIPPDVLAPHARMTLNRLADGDARFRRTRLHADLGGCAHFLMGVGRARSRIINGTARNAVVVTATDISRCLDPRDPDTAVLFGDGACAVLLRKGADGERGRIVFYYERIDRGRIGVLYFERKDGNWYTRMDGRAVFKLAVRSFEDSIVRTEREGYPVAAIDHFCPHQANLKILDLAIRKAGIPPAKVHSTLRTYGNTSSASVGITLYEAREAIKPGEKVLLLGFGAGFAWNALLIQY